jgi:hypothetical protein
VSVSVSVCEACGVPYGRSVSASELGEEAGGCIQRSFACYIHPSRLPAECILPLMHGMCIYFPIVFCLPARDI